MVRVFGESPATRHHGTAAIGLGAEGAAWRAYQTKKNRAIKGAFPRSRTQPQPFTRIDGRTIFPFSFLRARSIEIRPNSSEAYVAVNGYDGYAM